MSHGHLGEILTHFSVILGFGLFCFIIYRKVIDFLRSSVQKMQQDQIDTKNEIENLLKEVVEFEKKLQSIKNNSIEKLNMSQEEANKFIEEEEKKMHNYAKKKKEEIDKLISKLKNDAMKKIHLDMVNKTIDSITIKENSEEKKYLN